MIVKKDGSVDIIKTHNEHQRLIRDTSISVKGWWYECTNCLMRIFIPFTETDQIILQNACKYNYCPGCGEEFGGKCRDDNDILIADLVKLQE